MKHSYLRSVLTLILGSIAMVGFSLTPQESNLSSRANMRPDLTRIVATTNPLRGSSAIGIDPQKTTQPSFECREVSDRNSAAGTQESTYRIKKTSDKYYTVTCILEGEYSPSFSIYNREWFEDRSSFGEGWVDEETMDAYRFQVPAGTYDICVRFWHEYEGYNGRALVIHENVEINGDTTVEFSKNEATTVQRIQPVLTNGSVARFPQGSDDSNATANWIIYDGHLMRQFGDEFQTIESYYHELGYCPDGDTEDFYFITNELSDNYVCMLYSFVQSYGETHEYDISTTLIRGVKNRILPTYNNYIKYPFPEYVITPDFQDMGWENWRSSVSGSCWIDNVSFGGGGLYVPEEVPDIYVASQPTDLFDIKTVVNASSVQFEKLIVVEPFPFPVSDYAEIDFLPAWYNGNNWEYINQNHSECGNWSYQAPESGPVFEYPGLPAYCFTADEVTQPFGNSAPILVWMTQTKVIDEKPGLSVVPQAWIGRYGEVRNCDNRVSEYKIEDGKGNVLYDSAEGVYIEEFFYNYFQNEHEAGPLKGISTNTNVLVDNEIKGYCKSTIEIDETREDVITPTPQMLIFKNTDGAITDRFNTPKDGVIEFSAGDFIWHHDEENFNFYYSVEEADVKVEFAPYGEQAWKDLPVVEVPENFYMPGFGYFYRGSLECVDVPSSNGWYDLKMTLTDKAGNVTIEEISPAFKIGNGGGSGMNSVAIDGVKVWVADGMIRTNADAATIEVFAMDGSRIANGTADMQRLLGYNGIVLIRLTTTDGRVSTHKLPL